MKSSQYAESTGGTLEGRGGGVATRASRNITIGSSSLNKPAIRLIQSQYAKSRPANKRFRYSSKNNIQMQTLTNQVNDICAGSYKINNDDDLENEARSENIGGTRSVAMRTRLQKSPKN